MVRVVLWLWLLIGFATVMHAADPPPRLNVLMLFADDMRAESVAALGNPVVKTPNLDGLVKRGFFIRNAYCLGGNSPAVCRPSRNMLLSGNAYFRWKDVATEAGKNASKGMYAPAEWPNWPTTFKQAGYVTYHHGKRGNTAPPIQAQFEINRYLVDDDAERQSGEPGKEIADAAVQFLKDRKLATDGKPFCMYLAFANPHDPRVAAPQYLQQYDAATIPLPRNWRPLHTFDNGEMTVRDEKLLPWPRTEAALRKIHHDYYATITAMDFHIGRILAALKDSGQLDRTLILFSADQGIAIGSHGLMGKQNLYDHSMKVPLVFAGPGVNRGESPALVHLFDIFPTVCALAGIPAPSGLDGRSFADVLTGKTTTARKEIMLAYMDKQRAIRDERWKLIRYPHVDVTQLFDVGGDPNELRDLADSPKHKARVADMLKRLAALQKHYDDDLPLTVPEPKPKEWTPPKS